MKTLGMTTSTCAQCRRLVPAKVVADGAEVCFLKVCPEHGESRALVRRDADDYLRAQRFVKTAWKPVRFDGETRAACPDGCGFCERHEQHLCMPIVEITSRCDLTCPVCLVAVAGNGAGCGESGDLSAEEFRAMVQRLLAAERQIDLLNLSGGEPLLHPRLLDLVDEALSHQEIVRVSVSTNGRRLLHEPRLLREFRARNVVVSLQFDGLDDEAYQILRGERLGDERRRILERLREEDVTTSLTMTAAEGVNDHQFPLMLEHLFQQDNIVSLMVQPVAFTGRAEGLRGRAGRLTIPDIIRKLDQAGHPAVRAADFVPLPCSHPLCFSLAFYLITGEGGSVSVNRLVDASSLMDSLSNRTVFGLDADEHQHLKRMVYDLWSGPAGLAPDSQAVLATVRELLRDLSCASCGGGFDPRRVFAVAERRLKSIFIHAFQDAETFDLDRVRKCCQAYPQPDGRQIPACVRNVLRRPPGASGNKRRP